MSLDSLVSKWQTEGDAKGVIALKALDYCHSNMQTPPEWVIESIVECWQHYCDGTPVTEWEPARFKKGEKATIVFANVPETLDAAFGVPSRKRPDAKRNATIRWFGPLIKERLENAGLGYSDYSFEFVAGELDITSAQARKWYYAYIQDYSLIS